MSACVVPILALPLLGQINSGGTTLEIAPLANPWIESSTWGHDIGPEMQYATFQYRQTAQNTTTLLLIHTTVETGPPANEALIAFYPFLGPPKEDWTTSNSAFGNVLSGYSYSFANPNANQLSVPPARVAAHIKRFLDNSSGPNPDFGPTGYLTNNDFIAFTRQSQPSSLVFSDERNSVASGWNESLDVVNVRQAGRNSVILAARIHAGTENLPGLDALNATLDDEYGFVIHVQMVHVTRSGSGSATLSFSNGGTLRQDSCKAQGEEEWNRLVGAIPIVPSVVNGSHRIHCVERGQKLYVLLQPGVGYMALQAIVPTTDGGFAVLDRVPNLNNMRPDIAGFNFPGNGACGFGYIFNPALNVDPWGIVPLFSYPGSIAFSIFAFTK